MICFGIGTSITYNGIKKKFSPSLLLGFAFYCFTAIIAQQIIFSLYTQLNEDLAKIIINTTPILFILFATAILLYTDQIFGVSISYKTLIGLFLCGVLFGVAWHVPIIIEYNGGTGWTVLWHINFASTLTCLLIFVFSNLFLALLHPYREIKDKKQRLMILSVFWGIIIAIGGNIIEAFLTWTGLIIPPLSIYSLFLGIAVIGAVQIIEPLALYFVNAEIDACVIVNESGIPYVTYTPKGKNVDGYFVSSFLTGILSAIKEVLKAEKGIKSLDSGDKKILFEYHQLENGPSRIIAFLISDIETISLRDSLSHILDSFLDQYGTQLEDAVNTGRFKSFEEEIAKELSFTVSQHKI